MFKIERSWDDQYRIKNKKKKQILSETKIIKSTKNLIRKWEGKKED